MKPFPSRLWTCCARKTFWWKQGGSWLKAHSMQGLLCCICPDFLGQFSRTCKHSKVSKHGSRVANLMNQEQLTTKFPVRHDGWFFRISWQDLMSLQKNQLLCSKYGRFDTYILFSGWISKKLSLSDAVLTVFFWGGTRQVFMRGCAIIRKKGWKTLVH